MSDAESFWIFSSFCPTPCVFTYETPAQFRVALRTALASTPAPLSEEESHALSPEPEPEP